MSFTFLSVQSLLLGISSLSFCSTTSYHAIDYGSSVGNVYYYHYVTGCIRTIFERHQGLQSTLH